MIKPLIHTKLMGFISKQLVSKIGAGMNKRIEQKFSNNLILVLRIVIN